MNSLKVLLSDSEGLVLVHLKTRITKSGILRIPEELKEMFGHDMKIITVTGAAAFLCPEEIANEDVLRSIELIKEDLELRLSKEKSKVGTNQLGESSLKNGHTVSIRSGAWNRII